MKNKKDIQDELKEIAPTLAKLRETSGGFNVPNNYFELLTESMMEQAKLEPKPQVVEKEKLKIPWYEFLLRPQILGGLATMIVLIGTILFFRNQSSQQMELVAISADEAVTYVFNHLDDFETTLFLEDDFLGEISEVDLDEMELDQYLEENIDDIDESILEELL